MVQIIINREKRMASVMLNDISSLLLTVAGASASFVAILGGFIASKLISINSDRSVAESNLEEVKYQKFLKTEERDMLRRSMDEEDSICYIYEHMAELTSGLKLEDVYAEDELQTVEFETLLPLWKKAQFYVQQFDECLQKGNCKFNSDMIPCELAEEHTDDPFVYELLMMYAGWGFSDDIEEMPPRPRAAWYDKNKEQVLQANMQAAALDIQQQRYEMDLNRARKPKGMKTGLLIFALFSVFNIVLPLFLSVTAIPQEWNSIVAYCVIGMLALGLGVTLWYLVKMLKWK